MATYIVEKTISFCAGHRLLNYEGKCKYLHGHNYEVKIGLSSDKLDDRGMVVDFGDIKKYVKSFIDKWWDHGLILNREDPLISILKDSNQKIYIVDENPTAEYMASSLFAYVKRKFSNIDYIKVQETPTGTCEYYE